MESTFSAGKKKSIIIVNQRNTTIMDQIRTAGRTDLSKK